MCWSLWWTRAPPASGGEVGHRPKIGPEDDHAIRSAVIIPEQFPPVLLSIYAPTTHDTQVLRFYSPQQENEQKNATTSTDLPSRNRTGMQGDRVTMEQAANEARTSASSRHSARNTAGSGPLLHPPSPLGLERHTHLGCPAVQDRGPSSPSNQHGRACTPTSNR